MRPFARVSGPDPFAPYRRAELKPLTFLGERSFVSQTRKWELETKCDPTGAISTEISTVDHRDDAWNLIKAGRYDEAARQLARHIDTGIDVGLGHFGNKAVAELAAYRPQAEPQSLASPADCGRVQNSQPVRQTVIS